MNEQTRREFIKTSAKGAAGAAIGLGAIDDLLAAKNSAASGASTAGNNSKSIGSVINLPKGGGAVKGIGETFQPNPFTGTANISVPIATSPGRNGFGPELSLQYSSGNGNGPFGMGWNLSVPQISRKTEQGIPKYNEKERGVKEIDKDVFLLSGAEDLVLRSDVNQLGWPTEKNGFKITYYRPRTEGLFAKIEKWEKGENASRGLNQIFWKITTKENISSIYGLTQQASIADPNDKQKIFQWFLELTYDARGNYLRYTYKHDKGDNINPSIFERHRIQKNQTWQVYLKSIHYGNKEKLPGTEYSKLNSFLSNTPNIESCHFHTVFDYGEHGEVSENGNEEITRNMYSDSGQWLTRNDPFSFYRSNFEIRTYRLCKRVLMFHNFPEIGNVLVKSTDFKYQQDPYNKQSMLVAVTQRGYRKKNTGEEWKSEEYYMEGNETYVSSTDYYIKSLPPLEFNYSQYQPEKRNFKPIETENNELPSTSLANINNTLIDLFACGLPDLCEFTPHGIYYNKNLGKGRFSRKNKLKNAPAGLTLDMEGVGFGDVNGNGQADLLVHQGAKWGYWESNSKGGWKSHFKTYKNSPSFNLDDPSIRLCDLTGDKTSDILCTDIRSFTWYPCKKDEGWGNPKYAKRIHDLEKFPDVYFADTRIRLADMNGADGLQDIVFLHSDRIDYYPNLGYGRFGERITMGKCPHFGANFDPKRLFLVDIDGSGSADLVYVESGKVRFWFNRSGNEYSDEFEINGTPRITNSDSIQFADILGNGSNCLIYSTDYTVPGRSNYWYLDFTGGVKPNLLIEMNNNLGATTRATYKPSTYFFLEDQYKNPWLSTLPFPVQVLEKLEVIDHVSHSKLVTKYHYRHGYYDGREREFRGFSYVQQWDTEHFDDFKKLSGDEGTKSSNINKGFHVPPICTKTWYHIGAYEDNKAYSELKGIIGEFSGKIDFHNLFSDEYYKGDTQAYDLPNSLIDTESIDINSLHEAYRALRGSVLRQEIYAEDGSDKEKHPYIVTESNFVAKNLQPKGRNKHAIYWVYPNESLSYHYERKPSDPRISHEITLNVDDYGNITDKTTIAYPRRSENNPLPEQQENKIVYTWNNFINKDREADFYCLGIPCESKTYELVGLIPSSGGRFSKNELFDSINSVSYSEKDYHFIPDENDLKYKRLLKWNRTYYKKNDSAIKTGEGKLPLCEIQSLMLPYEQLQAAFKETTVTILFGKNPENEANRVTPIMLSEEGYLSEDGYYWIPSNQQAFDDKKFYLPVKNVDPFKNAITISYDDYSLLPEETIDPLQNTTIAKNDYYTLQPVQITDPNNNRTQVAFDALGLVAGTAIMGKENRNEGDSFIGFEANFSYQQIINNIDLLNEDNARIILKNLTSCIIYDLWRFKRLKDSLQPVAACTISREVHYHELEEGQDSPVQLNILYSDGLGREIQTKVLAEPSESNPNTNRWLTSGWKIQNNKGGKPVKQFEPFFSDNHKYEYDLQIGVSPVIFYDPLERIVAMLHPNNTFEKVRFDAWQQTTWDTNDTVLMVPKEDEDIGGYVKEYFNMNFNDDSPFVTWYKKRLPNGLDHPLISQNSPEQIVAFQAQKHADTPTKLYLDNLARPFLTIQDNGTSGTIETKVILDIEGNELEIIDPRGIHTFKHNYTMAGEKFFVDSVDAGIKINFSNVLGNPVRSWDANGNHMKTRYDKLQRPTEMWVTDKDDNTFLAQKTIYGEDKPGNSTISNHCLQVYKVYDGAGLITSNEYDFKGNLKSTGRKLLRDATTEVKWAESNMQFSEDTASSKLEDDEEEYRIYSTYDALNRVSTNRNPDNSTLSFKYNKRSLIEKIDLRQKDNSNNWKDTHPIKNCLYNAKGQKKFILYGNEVRTKYEYYKDTFRLKNIYTYRQNNENNILQDLKYVYDPVGNISYKTDIAIPVIWHDQQKIEPESHYVYDAIYRLILATGREHKEMTDFLERDNKKYNEPPFLKLPPSSDTQALHIYTEHYEYDNSGNFLRTAHYDHKLGNLEIPESPNTVWNSYRQYEEGSNRIVFLRNNKRNRVNFPNSNRRRDFTHDANGNITAMPHLPKLTWNFANQLVEVELNLAEENPDKAYYQYDLSGMRVRKIVKKNSKIEERIYLGGFEIYKETGGTEDLQRNTIQVKNGESLIALVEQKAELGDFNKVKKTRTRFQLTNHLGTSTLELDDSEDANILSYEEYYSYGARSYSSGETAAEVSLKRYKYSGKELDSESGLMYYGARYYADWLGRWLSCDPIGPSDGINLYLFISNNSVNLIDHLGLEGGPRDEFEPGVPNIDYNPEAPTHGGDPDLLHDEESEILLLSKNDEPKDRIVENSIEFSSEFEKDFKEWADWSAEAEKKFRVGLDIYKEDNLAYQITDILSTLLYRKGQISKKGKLIQGEGLVCVFFLNIFGALWFEGDPSGIQRRKTKKEKKDKTPLIEIFAKRYDLPQVNEKPLNFKKLVEILDEKKLYAVQMMTKKGKNLHVFILIHHKTMGWLALESTGKLKTHKGPGPGIYKSEKFKGGLRYIAWDWGTADKPKIAGLENKLDLSR